MIEIPKNLFIKGKLLPRDKRAVAIIGSRKMSEYGRQIAYDFSFYLATAGITIISGMARGIDTTAHKGALAAGGRTIAVLGSGLDVIYPPENKELSGQIANSGALVTEFKLGTPPFGKNFLQRNRIIAGLSLAVLVVEGARRSGTLSTVNYAANMGVEIFAVPGPITSELSYLPNYLIENGARVATSPEVILEYINCLE